MGRLRLYKPWFPLVLLVAALLSTSLAAKNSNKKRVLVLLQSLELKYSHSLFFDDLKANGFIPILKLVSDKGVALDKWNAYQYDYLILFTPSASSFGKKVSMKEILEFIDSGKNVILVGNSELSKKTFDVAADCGADFEAPGTKVYDHVHYAKLSGEDQSDHKLIVVEPEEAIRKLFNKRKMKATTRPLLFRGIGHSVAPDHDGVTVAVAGNPTTYSFKKTDKIPDDETLLAGRDVTLVSLIQTTNNARVAVVGSLDFFGNDLFTATFTTGRQTDSTKSGNREFAADLALWTFQSICTLRAESPRHVHAQRWTTPEMYTVNDPIHFEVDIKEWTIDHWHPYRSDAVQIEYYMMAPFIRTLLQDQGNGTFALNLQAPDVYGVFKFLVTHHRPGYSNIDVTEMAPIRPFRHNQYERFILTAYPYYVSVFSMMIGFWVFTLLYLYHKTNNERIQNG